MTQMVVQELCFLFCKKLTIVSNPFFQGLAKGYYVDVGGFFCESLICIDVGEVL